MKILLRFAGIDSWNRPVFKSKDGSYYGSTDKIYNMDVSPETIKKEITVKDLVWFGNEFDCEPMGNPLDEKIDFEIIWEDHERWGEKW